MQRFYEGPITGPQELSPIVRLALVSDIHVRHFKWRLPDFFSRRAAGWFNSNLSRRKAFSQAAIVLEALRGELRAFAPARILFAGDATTLGFEQEMRMAADLLGVEGSIPGIAVPGNHDYYTPSVAQEGHFERFFRDWQHGQRIDGHCYPFAQLVGEYWIVGLNSAVGQWIPWSARGEVGAEQRLRLARLLAELPPGPRILLTHYPFANPCDHRERFWRALRDVNESIRVAAEGNVCLWLHGHCHHPYHLQESHLAPFPVICNGSTTQAGVWTYTQIELQGSHARCQRRAFEPKSQRFELAESFELLLPIVPAH